MRVIIAGSRNVTNVDLLKQAIRDSGFNITEVVSGGARGVDRMGEQWARCNAVPFCVFHAEWHLYGRAAGPIRNARMASYADALIALWDGKSRGTLNMLREAGKLGLAIHIHKVSTNLTDPDGPQ